jgi:hypothetical protein
MNVRYVLQTNGLIAGVVVAWLLALLRELWLPSAVRIFAWVPLAATPNPLPLLTDTLAADSASGIESRCASEANRSTSTAGSSGSHAIEVESEWDAEPPAAKVMKRLGYRWLELTHSRTGLALAAPADAAAAAATTHANAAPAPAAPLGQSLPAHANRCAVVLRFGPNLQFSSATRLKVGGNYVSLVCMRSDAKSAEPRGRGARVLFTCRFRSGSLRHRLV